MIRPRRLTSIGVACLMLAGACAALLAAGATWQLAGIVARLVEFARPARAGRTSVAEHPAPARSEGPAAPRVDSGSAGAAATSALDGTATTPALEGTATTPALDGVVRASAATPGRAPPLKPTDASLVSIGDASARGSASAATTFEADAEDTERIIPVGLSATLDLAEEEPLAIGHAPPASFPRRSDCGDVFVYIVTIAEGAPKGSAASLGVGEKSPARLRRPGEQIGDWTVVSISDNWSGLNPVVWLEKDGAVCKAELAGNPARVHVPLKRPAPPRAKTRKRRRAKR